MSKKPYKINNIKMKKYDEFILKNDSIQDTDEYRKAFYSAFNIGYTACREHMRNNITDKQVYDECIACGCLSLTSRESMLCTDCEKITPKVNDQSTE